MDGYKYQKDSKKTKQEKNFEIEIKNKCVIL